MPLPFFNKNRPANGDASPRKQSSHHAHMTWASRTANRSVSATRDFLKQQVWVRPLIVIALLSVVGWLVRGAIGRTMHESVASDLNTLLRVEVAMLENWLDGQQRNAESLANDAGTREMVDSLLNQTEPQASAGLIDSLAETLAPAMASYEYDGFVVIDKQKQVVAATERQAVEAVDLDDFPGHNEFITRALEGQPTVSRPLPSVMAVKDRLGRVRTGTPVMFVCAPIRDENFQVIAALAFRFTPEKEFTRILQLGQLGDSGETYAFDEQGLMLSQSRFDEELILLGLLPDEEGSQSILRLLIRDPGGDIARGHRPQLRRRDLPPTRMVASAVTGESGFDADGYRDYRGVKVVGAWTWLKDYGFGVATELNYSEAYRPLTILERTFWALFALLAISSLGIFLSTQQVARLRVEAQKAAVEAQQLGQYTLEHKLGAGSMGVVYKAHHAMLRRPTAVKMLEPGKVTDSAAAAFEREVQITSLLCHPNTVAIYDYGHTPEGLFYYAMEYLDGIDLQQLIERYGPQPVGRVVDLLQQVCGSLYEAHTEGLVHRDIKPANIMLNRRGADPDVIKVLDFGLVKATEDAKGATAMAGTPLYMSPEAIETPDAVDPRSDLYAVGAVGYYLLTGRTVFEADSVSALCRKHISEAPRAPSQVLGRKLPVELEDALLACLEKSRAKRPQTARDMSLRLDRVPRDESWDVEKADLWWNQHDRGVAPTAQSLSAAITRDDQSATIDH